MSAAQIGSAGGTALAVIDEARAQLQRVFIAFTVTLVVVIWSMRRFIWDFLEATTRARMDAAVSGELNIIVRTPFDVILLQVKIGLIMAILVALVMIGYYGRSALIERGVMPDLPMTKPRRWAFVAVAAVLGVLGMVYAYWLFFPFMFAFLAENALISGVSPEYDIVMWTEFLALLTISFGLAAQIPLFMTVASYTEIISYEAFRDKWKYAIVGIFGFGALFSPPDPFTQLMWGFPLVALYFFSLALAKLAANLSRAEAAHDPAVQRALRRKTAFAIGAGVIVGVLAGVVARYDLLAAAGNSIEPYLPDALAPIATVTADDLLFAEGTAGIVALGVVAGIVTIVFIGLIYAIGVLRRPIPPSHHAMIAGDPADLDLRPLDAEGLRAAPIQAFAAMEEDEAVSIAQEALRDGDSEKAEVVLDRFDEGQELLEAEELEVADDDEGSIVQERATGLVDAFTEDETTEEDIGGYWHDIVFIYESLTSRMFRIVAVFLAVTGGVFFWLYSGGIGALRDDFIGRMPGDVMELAEGWPVALHPVEVLLFNVKISLVIAVLAVLPLILYYAWPALGERGFVSGDRRVFLFWAGLIFAGLAIGSWIGYTYIAAPVISGLVFHSIDAGMVVNYRLNSFAWLVFFTTIGIGLLFNLLMTMILFHLTDILTYQTMRKRWRGFVVGTLILGALFTPGSILTMLLITVPVLITFGLGLAILWVVTLPSRRESLGRPTKGG